MMRIENIPNTKWTVRNFDSLKDFYDYIETTPTNETFKSNEAADELSSHDKSKEHWYGTKSYEEATELFLNGWDAGAKDLSMKLKIANKNKQVDMVYKNIMSVCGYQAIVPLYLNGIPNNMINRKMVPIKNKVITINKVISVNSATSIDMMKEESMKCFQIIKKIEESGMRVNLNLIMGSRRPDESYYVCAKIRLKSANERLNISKLAFPLVHPSMFRRMYFRFTETFPTIPSSFSWGYGSVPREREFRTLCKDKEIMLPTIIRTMGNKQVGDLSIEELLERFK